MIPRLLHRIYAYLFGYFWRRCPLCDQWFGGHEWKHHDPEPASIQAPGGVPGLRVAICRDCTRDGRGDAGNIVVWTDKAVGR